VAARRGGGAGVKTVDLCGVRFAAITEDQCIRHVIGESTGGRGGWVVTANLDHMRRLVHDPEYHALCGGAALVVADGMPVVWAAKLAGRPVPERVAGSTMTRTLSEAAGRAGRSIYLLGGDRDTAERAGRLLAESCPGLTIAGTFSPPFGFERDAQQMADLRRRLIESNPDIVYVALGSPKQERLIADLRGDLPGAWWLGVGISFSFLTGDVKRAPRWMQRVGLEWVHRLAQEPGRLAKRYLVLGIPFAAELFARALIGRFRPGTRRRPVAGEQ